MRTRVSIKQNRGFIRGYEFSCKTKRLYLLRLQRSILCCRLIRDLRANCVKCSDRILLTNGTNGEVNISTAFTTPHKATPHAGKRLNVQRESAQLFVIGFENF
ncbi:hypothetical protein EMIT0347P_80090 [Pseudomonas sp. IT-347P]